MFKEQVKLGLCHHFAKQEQKYLDYENVLHNKHKSGMAEWYN